MIMFVNEDVIGLFLINLVIYCFIGKIIHDTEEGVFVIPFIIVGLSSLIMIDYLPDMRFNNTAKVFEWLVSYSSLELFFIFVLPLVIAGVILYLTNPSNYAYSRVELYLLRVKKKIRTKKLEKRVERKEKLARKEIEKTKALESKIEDTLFDYASKNKGIIMKSELFDVAKNYNKRDVINIIDKLKNECIIETHDNSYMFMSLV